MFETAERPRVSTDRQERLSRQICGDFHTLAAILKAECPVPDGHQWEASPHELTWWDNNTLQSTYWGASIFLTREIRDCTDPDQIHAEVRWFWRATTGDKVPDPSSLRHEAILWCQRGTRFSGGFRSILAPATQFTKAGTILKLASLSALAIRSALQL
jgi:hypothetical protein